jgi:anti-anti-sigma regulatory factor
MNISTSQVAGRVPVTVLSIQGDLDGSNYKELIAKAQELYQAGARHLILDMSQVPFMSSAGIMALHSTALLIQGDKTPDPEQGWAALHAATEKSNSLQTGVKLVNLQPKVDRTVQLAGMKSFFEIYPDLAAALASF